MHQLKPRGPEVRFPSSAVWFSEGPPRLRPPCVPSRTWHSGTGTSPEPRGLQGSGNAGGSRFRPLNVDAIPTEACQMTASRGAGTLPGRSITPGTAGCPPKGCHHPPPQTQLPPTAPIYTSTRIRPCAGGHVVSQRMLGQLWANRWGAEAMHQ